MLIEKLRLSLPLSLLLLSSIATHKTLSSKPNISLLFQLDLLTNVSCYRFSPRFFDKEKEINKNISSRTRSKIYRQIDMKENEQPDSFPNFSRQIFLTNNNISDIAVERLISIEKINSIVNQVRQQSLQQIVKHKLNVYERNIFRGFL